ncbi:excisionase family DNA-binding protein [Mycolicibacterium pulveris]|uniref:excisionase family DNA-binding protein n=1 Tax=Mycolicibacterium pulveris TaxID=36813 RepID=UPI003CF36061
MTTATQDPTPRRVSIRKAARHAGLDERTVRRLIDEGTIPAYQAGPRIFRIDLDEMDRALRIT